MSPCSAATFAARRSPSTTTRRDSTGSAPSPGWPVRQRITSGSNGAKRRIASHSPSVRSFGSVGPGNGTGQIDSVPGMHVVAFSPLSLSRASASASSPSPSLNSQIPIPSTPASRYVVEVLLERLVERRDLGDGELRLGHD